MRTRRLKNNKLGTQNTRIWKRTRASHLPTHSMHLRDRNVKKVSESLDTIPSTEPSRKRERTMRSRSNNHREHSKSASSRYSSSSISYRCTSSSSEENRRSRFGRCGDPRMNRALELKLFHSDMASDVALRLGGYEYTEGAKDCAVDSDGVTLSQRRNQLARRLRNEKRKAGDYDGRDYGKGARRSSKRKKRTRSARRARSVSPSPSNDEKLAPPPPLPGDDVKLLSPQVSDLSSYELSTSDDIKNIEQFQTMIPYPDWQEQTNEPESVKMTTFAEGNKATASDELKAGAGKVQQVPTAESNSQRSPEDPIMNAGGDYFPLMPSLSEATTPAEQSHHPSPSNQANQEVSLKNVNDVDVDEDDSKSIVGENLTEEDIFGLTSEEVAEAHADVRGLRRLDSALVQGLMKKFMNSGSDLSAGSSSRTGVVVNPNAKNAGKSLESLMSPAVRSLLHQMKLEIENRPMEERQAMLRAFCSCSASDRNKEFSDQRLELFLRREDMNPVRAAKRFVLYWQKRRELFGSDKFYLPLSLGGAVKDDRPALDLGHWIILPEHDDYGRTMMLWLKRGPYQFESMARAIFYIAEQAMELPSSSKGVVWLTYDRNTNIWNYDRRLDEFVCDLEEHYLPMKVAAIHVCSIQGYLWRVLKPLILACLDKRTRARLRIHLASDGDIVDILKGFGIRRSALPTLMGGEVDCDLVYGQFLRERSP